jgi:hypothetical protein
VEDSISVSLWIILESEAWIRMGGIQDSNSGFGNFAGGEKSERL